MIVSITGSTGNMGLAVLKELCTLSEITTIKLLVRSNNKVNKLQKLLNKIKSNIKVEYILGDMNSSKAIEELTNNTNYVINMAAVIPPHSDKNIKAAINCNEIGVKNLIQACENIILIDVYKSILVIVVEIVESLLYSSHIILFLFSVITFIVNCCAYTEEQQQ